VEEFCESTGWDVDAFVKSNKEVDVMRVSRNGVPAFATCTHCQFLTSKEAVSSVLPLEGSDKPMGGVSRFDEGVESAGLMRLSTARPYVLHMGNRITPRLRNTVAQYGIQHFVPDLPKTSALSLPAAWLLKQKGTRWLLREAYSTIFKLVTISEGKLGESRK
jgi:hypothetical protein